MSVTSTEKLKYAYIHTYTYIFIYRDGDRERGNFIYFSYNVLKLHLNCCTYESWVFQYA